MPSMMPNTAESTAAIPTSAIVAPALLLISSQTGWLVGVRAPEVELGGLLEVVDELLARASRRARTAPLSSARWLCDSSWPRYRFATGSGVHDPEQEEVEADDEGQRDQRTRATFSADEPGAHSRSSRCSAWRRSQKAIRRRAEQRGRDDRDDAAASAAVVVTARAGGHRLELRVRRRGIREEHRPDVGGLLGPAREAVLAVGLRSGSVVEHVVDGRLLQAGEHLVHDLLALLADRARPSAACRACRTPGRSSSRRCSSWSGRRDRSRPGCRLKYESIVSGSTYGVQPHAKMS